MDLDRLLSFMMKRDMVVKEATSVFNSKYYAFTHKIQISGETSAEWLVNYLHESIHYYINGFPICNLRTDIAFLFNYLHYYYVKRKGELLIENEVVLKNNREVMEDVQYVIAYQHEIDLLLSRDDRLVEFCKYCIDIYQPEHEEKVVAILVTLQHIIYQRGAAASGGAASGSGD